MGCGGSKGGAAGSGASRVQNFPVEDVDDDGPAKPTVGAAATGGAGSTAAGGSTGGGKSGTGSSYRSKKDKLNRSNSSGDEGAGNRGKEQPPIGTTGSGSSTTATSGSGGDGGQGGGLQVNTSASSPENAHGGFNNTGNTDALGQTMMSSTMNASSTNNQFGSSGGSGHKNKAGKRGGDHSLGGHATTPSAGSYRSPKKQFSKDELQQGPSSAAGVEPSGPGPPGKSGKKTTPRMHLDATMTSGTEPNSPMMSHPATPTQGQLPVTPTAGKRVIRGNPLIRHANAEEIRMGLSLGIMEPYQDEEEIQLEPPPSKK
ncbi:unnamed protein product [Amoebophrya sp. A25]|nr:unnamed protein product [Amoebophrya sp. A25]|eukprot:GSA25T00014496001.1